MSNLAESWEGGKGCPWGIDGKGQLGKLRWIRQPKAQSLGPRLVPRYKLLTPVAAS